MTKVINIIGNSGSGKTVLAVNLAFALKKRGRDVILVDGNIYSPDIVHHTNISPSSYLNEFLYGEKNIEDIIFYHPAGIRIIPSIVEDTHDEKKHEKINHAILSLMGKSDIILVDSFSHSPALHSVVHSCDENIFVTLDDFASIIKSREFVRKFENRGIGITGIVLNKKRKGTGSEYVEAITQKSVLSEIPYDEKLIDSINKRMPAVLHNPSSFMSKAAHALAEMLDIDAAEKYGRRK